MNKIGITLAGLLMAGAATTAKAQEPSDCKSAGTINWQLRGGMGYADVVSVPGTDGQFGYSLGVEASVPLSKSGVWRIEPGLLFSQKGWTFDGYYGSEQIMPASFDTKLRYLELPVLAAARLRLGRGNSLTLKMGPYVAYGLNAKTRLSINDTDHEETFGGNHFSESCDFYGIAYDRENHHVAYPRFNRWEVGLTEGADLALGHLIIGASLSLGLTPVSDEIFMGGTISKAASVVFFGGRPRNITAMLSVGYRF